MQTSFARRFCANLRIPLVQSQRQRILPNANTLRHLSPFSSLSVDDKDKQQAVTVPPAEVKPVGWFERTFGKSSCPASPSFKNRWLMALPVFATQMCIGSPWAWSIMGDIVTREVGFVASTAADWTLAQSCLPLSIVFVFIGTSAAALGPWQARVGHRTSILAAATAFGGGLALGSLGIYLHSLPLLYVGYGALGGTGLGLAYTPCISTLMQWFPDRKGTASGIAIAGFGSGALLFTPLVQTLTHKFAKMPEYIGKASDFVVKTVDGRQFADVNGVAVEVVNAMTSDLTKLSYSLSEGLYVVGSGSTGATEALAVCAAGYFTVMLASALALRSPHPSFVEGISATQSNAVVSVKDVSMAEAIRTPQFHLLGVTFACLAMGGMGIFSVAKPMMSEVFSGTLPHLVTSAFAAKFLLCLAMANLGGRLGWAILSDSIGRRKVFYIFTLSAIPLYLSMPFFVQAAVDDVASMPVYAFVASSVGAISIMGGTYAILPAYQADLFGAKNIGPTHGVMMLYSSVAALLGPALLLQLRQLSVNKAIEDLLTKVTPEDFHRVFGAPMEQAVALAESKVLTVSRLLTIAPPGTLDPTPHLYDTTMYTLSALMLLASVAHSRVKFPYVPLEARTPVDVEQKNKQNTN